MRQLIVTADDFGLDPAVNEAVEQAHRTGILTSASLMVAAPAAAQAVALAKRMPGLGVGLHLALVDAGSTLPAGEIPDLVDARGRFSDRQALAGFSYFFRPSVRRQLAAEIRAQFRAFAATGLPLDHVDAHKHMHLHPTVGRMLVEIGLEFGLKAVRIPDEPGHPALLSPWIGLLRRQARRAGLATPDRVHGIRHSGAMTEERVREVVRDLPDGVTELYSHPATSQTPALAALMPTYRPADEFAALASPEIKAMVEREGIRLTTYGALSPLPPQGFVPSPLRGEG
ncbi:hopanoid biosynthesis-associated protein HpnK [Azospirillum rugosum]|uniref:Hopanoid biosynthesis associated protein HpnK n=1 Tax=Azospirillum rugosum TaxID=416170 RepID=A0ABS4SI05_9PROT|nr:hopanoid biosynthesis-associated protein HpnK [Azospirillum rugosum]MBP2291683.1 hopanoid biosynthesis associated protein HpnK [Azospirillum rugosum]MDQ0524505.1 hopanoid biosynthesis associated protein HpnK [Azospirillum rugosum]